jgi:hypothetical protein
MTNNMKIWYKTLGERGRNPAEARTVVVDVTNLPIRTNLHAARRRLSLFGMSRTAKKLDPRGEIH